MKILYHHRTRSKDGQFVHIEEMIGALKRLGHEVIVVAPTAHDRETFGANAGLVGKLKRLLPNALYEMLELGYSYHAYRRLCTAIRKHRPQCIYERYNLFFPAGIWAKHKFKLPLLLEVNAPIYAERKKFDGLQLDKLALWSERFAWREADAVLPVTRVLAEIIAEQGVPRERIHVIPNGIDPRHFISGAKGGEVRSRFGLGTQLVLGFIGFVREWHGLDKVIDLIAHDLPGRRRHLLVVGDGPARASLEAQAAQLKLSDRVTFTGVVPRKEVPNYIAAFDIALQPAVVEYASPLKLFEYLALGKAIVAPGQKNIREVLRHGENAWLFDPQDSNGLAEAIEIVSHDVNLRARLAASAAQSIAAQGLTWEHNARRVTDLFRGLQTAHER